MLTCKAQICIPVVTSIFIAVEGNLRKFSLRKIFLNEIKLGGALRPPETFGQKLGYFGRFLSFNLYLYMCVFMCVTPPGINEKRYRPEIRHTLTSSKNGFFVFSKKWPWGQLASKNYSLTWIFRISLLFPCIFISTFICVHVSVSAKLKR